MRRRRGALLITLGVPVLARAGVDREHHHRQDQWSLVVGGSF
jgi:hypothetical protein